MEGRAILHRTSQTKMCFPPPNNNGPRPTEPADKKRMIWCPHN